jgi:GntR family transcriptional regulator
MDFDTKTPIYLQIIEMFRLAIAAGTFAAGSKVASVRDLAIGYGVNPNTVQRALSELERDGFLYTERTSGRYITRDAQVINRLRGELAEQQIVRFIEQMASIGYDQEQILKLLYQKWSESDAHH